MAEGAKQGVCSGSVVGTIVVGPPAVDLIGGKRSLEKKAVVTLSSLAQQKEATRFRFVNLL